MCVAHRVKLWSKFTDRFFDQRGGPRERHFCALFRVYCGSALRPCAAKEPGKVREGILIGKWLSSYVRYSYWHSGRTNSLQHKQIFNIRCRWVRWRGMDGEWDGKERSMLIIHLWLLHSKIYQNADIPLQRNVWFFLTIRLELHTLTFACFCVVARVFQGGC